MNQWVTDTQITSRVKNIAGFELPAIHHDLHTPMIVPTVKSERNGEKIKTMNWPGIKRHWKKFLKKNIFQSYQFFDARSNTKFLTKNNNQHDKYTNIQWKKNQTKWINKKHCNLIFYLEKLKSQTEILLNDATEPIHSKVAIMAKLNQKQ